MGPSADRPCTSPAYAYTEAAGGVSGVATTHHILSTHVAVRPFWRAPVFSYGEFIFPFIMTRNPCGSRESSDLHPHAHGTTCFAVLPKGVRCAGYDYTDHWRPQPRQLWRRLWESCTCVTAIAVVHRLLSHRITPLSFPGDPTIVYTRCRNLGERLQCSRYHRNIQ